MADLEKQPVPINFQKGLDLKSDPFQLSVGSFLELENSVFTKIGRLQKRNGYAQLASLPVDGSVYLTTFNTNLTAIGQEIQAYSMATNTWIERGTLQPVGLEVLPLVRTSLNQSQADSAVSPGGLVCTVYTDDVPSAGATAPSYKYVVADAETGQNIIAPAVITVGAGSVQGSPRVFVLGKYFVIVITNLITATYHLKYFTINTATLAVSSEATISSAYTPSSTVAFDGIVANNSLYLAWNGNDGGGAVRMAYLTSTLVVSSAEVFAGSVATMMSLAADNSGPTPIIYASFYDLASTTGYTLAVNQNLTEILAPTQIIASGTILNIASSASSGVCTVFYETTNAYSWDSSIKSNFISKKTITQAGSVSAATVVSRSVGLASKAFAIDGTIYVLSIYYSPLQPTYFLLNSSGEVIAKLAYQNGGPYFTKGLPSVSVTGSVASVSYLVKDLIQAVSKELDAESVVGVYSELGINLAKFDLGDASIFAAEIGSNLNITGGFLWGYDGLSAVENGFFVYPDSASATTSTGVTPTGDTTNGSAVITALSAMTSIGIGCTVTGAGIPGGATIVAISGSTITISAAATATAAGVTLTIRGLLVAQQYYYVATYEWSDNQGNVFRSAPSLPVGIVTTTATSTVTISVPTLRLTYKTANPAKIVLYRWSAAQQVFFQTTSITSAILNDKAVDSVSFVDSHSDAQILGNNILYTTGGIVENTSPPACTDVSLFNKRLFLISAEDNNLLFYSKQVLQATPVEMSDLFTLYAAPTTGAQVSTGGLRYTFPMDDKLILSKEGALYYVIGNGPDNTGANNDFSEPVFITSSVGSDNKNSAVLTPQGMMFQAANGEGIWLLGRDLSTSYIGDRVADYNSARVLGAVNVPGTNQVRFTLDSGITLMYDYLYDEWGTFVGVPAVSSTVYEALHSYINEFGQVFQENPGSYLDGARPVLMKLKTGWLNLAGLQGYQRAYFMYLLGRYISPHRLTISIGYDYNSSAEQVITITPDNYSEAYGDAPVYGSSEYYGGGLELERWRIFFEKQKCEAFQITIAESYDPSYGAAAGAGLTLSQINTLVGLKKAYSPIKAGNSAG